MPPQTCRCASISPRTRVPKSWQWQLHIQTLGQWMAFTENPFVRLDMGGHAGDKTSRTRTENWISCAHWLEPLKFRRTRHCAPNPVYYPCFGAQTAKPCHFCSHDATPRFMRFGKFHEHIVPYARYLVKIENKWVSLTYSDYIANSGRSAPTTAGVLELLGFKFTLANMTCLHCQ